MTKEVHAAAQLLERVPALIKNFEDHYQKTGLTYNIFKITGIGTREVSVCKVLADLLNPKGSHSQGDQYLKIFMDMVIKSHIEKANDFNLLKAKIRTEYPITEDRRIDIVIEDETMFIPMEVKVFAGEQKKQLVDYAAFSRRMNQKSGFIPVLFLTPDGYESGEASKEDYISISFKKHIIPWLTNCLNLEETQKIAPVREIIKQFIRVIKSFCGHVEDEEMENAIYALVTDTRDNYIAALQINNAVNTLDFDDKAWKIFMEGGQIYNLVKTKLPDMEYLETGDGEWHYFAIPIGRGCSLSINYNMKLISVQEDNSTKSLSAETAEKIKKVMSRITGVRDEEWEDYIWSSENTKCPGIEDTDNEYLYLYDLHQIYSKDPQSVADWIVSMVMELRNI